MVRETRVLYGLHERFVLFPYRQGAKRSRLIVRARYLRLLCRERVDDLTDLTRFPVGAPFVLGELLNIQVEGNSFVPVLMTGVEVHALRAPMVAWARRCHRAVISPNGSVAFESGTKHVFATKTAYYDFRVLEELIDEPSHEVNPRARFPKR